MPSHVLEAQTLTGTKVGHTVLVPKISLAPSDTNLPFILKRHQFPLWLAFATTINNAQSQTFARVGLLLQELCLRMDSSMGLFHVCEFCTEYERHRLCAMDDNAYPHRTNLVTQYLQDTEI
ncbi:hypothetical protein LAZ67_13001881 [Cordylochernes scorpioides]|uniref:Uncharacterized protein n=1 Tax=Cordylochernes scorpioides TaxID=51811 RepID=A0ABY6L473_9ARAC|nr:hypothetical protein LAZ67_13001881 [Cordylochernes scorpioides]